jgi:prepilin peptidase CpaA
MPEIVTVMHAVALAIAATAAVTDARTGLIPNWLTLPPLVAAPLLYGFIGGPSAGLWSVASLLVSGLVPYVLFRKGAIGGGDVKLFAALGAICAVPPGGPMSVSIGIEAQLYAFVAASVFALGRLAYQGKLLKTVMRTVFLMVNPVLPKRYRREIDPELMTSIRLGIPIFAGTAVAVLLHNRHIWSPGG